LRLKYSLAPFSFVVGPSFRAMSNAMELVQQEGSEVAPPLEQIESAVVPPDRSAEQKSGHDATEVVGQESLEIKSAQETEPTAVPPDTAAKAMEGVEQDSATDRKPVQEGIESVLVPPMVAALAKQVAALARQQQKPKKSVSSFWLFSGSVRAEISQELKEKCGKSPLGEIAKVTGERWKTLPDEQRKIFEDIAAENKQRYDVEMQEYLDACDPTAALRRRYAHLIPEKSLSPQHIFFKEAKQRAVEALRADGKDTGEKAVTAKLGEMWKGVSEEERNTCQQAHARQYLQFLGRQKVWQASTEFKEIELAERARQEMEKTVEMSKAAEEERLQQEKSRAAKRGRGAANNSNEVTPKRSRVGQSALQSVAKNPSQTSNVVTMCIDDKVLKEASKIGMEKALQNLAGRPEVVSSRKSGRAILDALKSSGGLVNQAKRVLLGA